MADTLLLPEKVELTGDTVILVRRLFFEGREVEIKGHFSIHVFPINEIALLGDTFQNAASKLGQHFELIKASGTAGLKGFTGKLEPIRGGRITLNTSGSGRKEWLEQQRQRQAAGGLKFLKAAGLAPPSDPRPERLARC